MIGSEGTLGVVTKLILKVLPLPKQFVSLLVPFDDIDQCARCVPLLLQTSPATLEYTEREVLLEAEQYLGKAFPHSTAAAYLIVSFYGNCRKAMEPTLDMAAEICMEQGALDVFLSDTTERQEAMWSARGAFLEAIKSSTPAMDECDVVLRIDKVASFIDFTKKLSDQYKIRIRSFGHAGDGNLHIYVCKDDLTDEAWEHANSSVMEALYAKAAEMGGKVSGEHGIGHAKRKFLLDSLGSLQMDIMGKIKQAFDPTGILNPGKILINGLK
jgi:glycolate oxidase